MTGLATSRPAANSRERLIDGARRLMHERGIESATLDKKKEYALVPVLRNLVPAQVLAGKSSFNAGNSLSAGLPVYARNSVKAIAAILERE